MTYEHRIEMQKMDEQIEGEKMKAAKHAKEQYLAKMIAKNKKAEEEAILVAPLKTDELTDLVVTSSCKYLHYYSQIEFHSSRCH